MKFNTFWKWLQTCSRKFDTLGYDSHFKIRVSKNAQEGLITSKQKLVFPFSIGDAIRTLDRYHGLRQAEDFLKKHLSILSPKKSPHWMASSYAKPVGLIQNWQDCPEPFQCAPWIAAAIRDFSHRSKKLLTKQKTK